MRALRPVNVSPKHMTYCNPPQLSQCCIVFVLPVSDQYPQKTHHQHERRWPSVLYAANVAPSRNLAKLVVAVAAVLGSKAAEVLGTQDFSTRGTRVYMPAKREHGPEQPSTNGKTLLNKKTLTLLMVMAKLILKVPLRPPHRSLSH